MKKLAVAFAAVLATTGLALAQAEAPAAKKDSGSLSSGAKDSMPATKNTEENTGSGTSSGASTGEAGSSAAKNNGMKKGAGATSDPAAGNK
jgi:hypothetical protein